MQYSTDQGGPFATRAADRQEGGVHILVTVVDGSTMAAAHATRESAMAAAVEFVQVEADGETRFSGSLTERFELARRHVVGHGGQMEIVISPIWGRVC